MPAWQVTARDRVVSDPRRTLPVRNPNLVSSNFPRPSTRSTLAQAHSASCLRLHQPMLASVRLGEGLGGAGAPRPSRSPALARCGAESTRSGFHRDGDKGAGRAGRESGRRMRSGVRTRKVRGVGLQHWQCCQPLDLRGSATGPRRSQPRHWPASRGAVKASCPTRRVVSVPPLDRHRRGPASRRSRHQSRPGNQAMVVEPQRRSRQPG